ncbi:putative membrane-bound lytic murein transglycosylase [Bradyrhizobium sp. ORS 375]|uniref:murein transglycosylase A n=1 Tax=Bradyrhizobium sp. (strain ORS 375) TaxID=566679 RepID=UPI0002408639|nr:MltA domain-containing protein [Bradyrhizobium sp. ORS 375]CCD96484.1 putative membrane-bound lytic murein transglycosylase [Bradyrhizobium sp. ORS 375]
MVREIWKRVLTARSLRYGTPALALSVAAVVLAPYAAEAVRARRHPAAPPMRHLPYPQLDWPLEISNSQYRPLSWSEVPGWADDDQLAAYRTFRASCKPIAAKPDGTPEDKALGDSLRDPCREARAAEPADSAAARAFFERNFEPLKISKLGDADGFVTGYYEPVIEGSRTQNEVYNVPVYRRPSNLFVRGFKQDATSLPNKGPVYRKIGRRKLVPYYDRAEIEDGAIEGRGLEIAWLRNQTDLLFAQIQGSARISLDDGSTVRINYDAYNGHPYTPVGRILIERGIIPREQMSMQRIRDWMEQNPEGANELRRMNRSYIFFREVQLSEKDEAVGAQGIPLTPGRSIAVDKSLHVYGTPFFITGELPIESEKTKNPFHRLMIAQDTGSAIVGPARADLYFGAGHEAGKVSGRLKHSIQFVILVPRSLDPIARGRKMPLPDARPSEKIAKLFPQVLPKEAANDAQKAPAKEAVKDQPKDQAKNQDQASGGSSSAKDAKAPAPAASATTTVAQNVVAPVPLPEARPRLESDRNSRRLRYGRRHRNHR